MRAAVSIGAYLGETLRASAGAEWALESATSGPAGIVLRLGEAELKPLERVWLRLQNQVGPLADYAERAARGA